MAGKLAILGGKPVRTRPFPTWPQYDREERNAVLEVFDSNRVAFPSAKDWEIKGISRIAFEKEFADFHNCKYGITTISGTSAIMVALRALGVMPGDEVLIQSYMCIADTEAIVQIGAIPVFCDINRNNYGINLKSIEQYITPKTKALIAIHYGGYMIDMKKVHEIAKQHNIEVVEDASLTHGGEWDHIKIGNFSKLTVFSLGIDKLMTVGEGGIIITNDSDLADFCDSLRNSGNIPCTPEVAEDRFLSEFTDIKRIGWNFRLTEIPSAIGLEGLKKLPYQVARRNENGLYLDDKLKGIEGIEPLKRDERQNLQPHGLYLFRLIKEEFGIDKETFIKAVNAEGIPALYGYHNPVYKYSVFQKEERYKNIYHEEAERACNEVIWFSQSVLLGTRNDMEDIVRAFVKVKDNVDKLKNIEKNNE